MTAAHLRRLTPLLLLLPLPALAQALPALTSGPAPEIGRASCRERVSSPV